MSNNDDKKWLNRELFWYKDNKYNTDCTIRISVSSSTEDDKNFSAPNLSLVLIDNVKISRFMRLCFNDIICVCEKLNTIFRNEVQAFQTGSIINLQKYDHWFGIKFQLGSNGEEIVVIAIVYNDTDKAQIAVSKDTFFSILTLFKYFKDNFWKIGTDLQNSYILSESLNYTKGIEKQLKLLPSLINSVNPSVQISNISIPNEPDEEVSEDTNILLNDFEKFTTESDPIIPELNQLSDQHIENKETEQEPIQEFNSPLLDTALACNIVNFENMMNTITVGQEWGTELFINAIKIPVAYKDDFKYLPGLTETDKKSFSYICKTRYMNALRNYIDNSIPVPPSFNILKYKPSEIKPENIELSYDLLMILSYIQSMRSILETRVSEAKEGNKALLCAATRCYIDPLIFSFIENQEPSVIKSCVLSRFRHYHSKGFFSAFEKHNEFNQVRKVNITDVASFLEKLTGILKSYPYIETVHSNMFKNGGVVLPYQNNFTIEQITNEIVPLQVTILLGGEINPKDEKIKKLFDKNEKKDKSKPITIKQTKEPSKYVSLIDRFINDVDFIKQIPESFKNEFLDHIKTVEGEYDYTKFSIEELGDDIVKALYTWNELENKKVSYSQFRSLIEECIMKKEDIIAKIKGASTVTDSIGALVDNWILP